MKPTPNILFVTGTDTGVGKTFVAASLVSALASRGISVKVLKPVETGCAANDGELVAEDAERLRLSSRSGQASSDVVAYRFSKPLAPSVAAALEGVQISPASIRERIEALAVSCDLVVVEGAGGVLVPLTEEYTFADLASESGAKTLVVVGSRLGALNHAALTFEALKSRSIPVIGYVCNEPLLPGKDDTVSVETLSTNRDALRKIAASYGIEEVSYVKHLSEDEGCCRSPETAARVTELAALRPEIKGLAEHVVEQFLLNG